MRYSGKRAPIARVNPDPGAGGGKMVMAAGYRSNHRYASGAAVFEQYIEIYRSFMVRRLRRSLAADRRARRRFHLALSATGHFTSPFR